MPPMSSSPLSSDQSLFFPRELGPPPLRLSRVLVLPPWFFLLLSDSPLSHVCSNSAWLSIPAPPPASPLPKCVFALGTVCFVLRFCSFFIRCRTRVCIFLLFAITHPSCSPPSLVTRLPQAPSTWTFPSLVSLPTLEVFFFRKLCRACYLHLRVLPNPAVYLFFRGCPVFLWQPFLFFRSLPYPFFRLLTPSLCVFQFPRFPRTPRPPPPRARVLAAPICIFSSTPDSPFLLFRHV